MEGVDYLQKNLARYARLAAQSGTAARCAGTQADLLAWGLASHELPAPADLVSLRRVCAYLSLTVWNHSGYGGCMETAVWWY